MLSRYDSTIHVKEKEIADYFEDCIKKRKLIPMSSAIKYRNR